MKLWNGIYLPEGELHLIEWMEKMKQERAGRPCYQLHKYDLAMKFVKGRCIAVDIGGHVGLWSWPMSHDFHGVIAFEPVTEHCACWRKNMESRENAVLNQVALGEKEGKVFIRCRTPGSSGDTGVDPHAEASSLRASVDTSGEEVQMKRLDSFGLTGVDFMKLDCEGYEVFALRGAEETLKRCKPCVIVEQKAETGGSSRYGVGVTDGVEYLKSLGAKLRGGVQGDYVLSWD